MKNQFPVYTCPLCNKQFQMGGGIWDGRLLLGYKITVCSACYDNNWDGWAPHYEDKLLSILDEQGIPHPERNAKGWLPREF